MRASPARILLGLVLGAVLGYLCVRSRFSMLTYIPGILATVGTLFVNAIRVCVVPLVVSSLIAGCAASNGDQNIGRIAGRSLLLILGYLSSAAIFAGTLAFPIFQYLHTLARGNTHEASNVRAPVAVAGGFGAWMSDLIPSNLFKAAADGDLLPLILFSITFGITLSRMTPEWRDPLRKWFQALAETFTRIIEIVLRTATIGVFCLAANMATTTGLEGAGALVGYIVILSVVSGAFIIVVLYPSVALFGRVPLRIFLRASAPAQALAFTSRSSLAALPATYQAARDGLGIPDDVSSFFFPFAASIFRVGGCMAQMVGICFLASFYGVSLSWSQLIGVAASAVAVSLTVPGIPGGAIIVMTPILTSLGIPLAGMAMLLAVDTIPDMFRTTANVSGWLSAGVILSSNRRPVTETSPEIDHADRELNS